MPTKKTYIITAHNHPVACIQGRQEATAFCRKIRKQGLLGCMHDALEQPEKARQWLELTRGGGSRIITLGDAFEMSKAIEYQDSLTQNVGDGASWLGALGHCYPWLPTVPVQVVTAGRTRSIKIGQDRSWNSVNTKR